MKEMHTDMQRVGARIQHARKARGFSQADMADGIGISTSHLSDIERGVSGFGVDILMRITEYLQVSADELLRTDIPEGNARSASEADSILEGCTPAQKEAMLQTLRNMKSAFLNS